MGDARPGPLPVPPPGDEVFCAGSLSVRRLVDDDVPSLVGWLSDPRVARWYEGRDRSFDADAVRSKFLRPDDVVWRCLVLEDGRAIGYLQVYEADDGHPSRDDAADGERVCGIDLFIGEPGLWNAGRGSRLVRAAAEYLLREWRADRVTIDPLVENGRAIRAYENAGFVIRRRLLRHDLLEGEWRDAWLMVFSEAPIDD